jgi:hypothetical protein
MIFPGSVTFKATGVHFLRGSAFECKDFGFISTARMLCTWPVARLATLHRNAVVLFRGRVPMPGLLKRIEYLFVAGLARRGTDIWGAIRRCFAGFGLAFRLSLDFILLASPRND